MHQHFECSRILIQYFQKQVPITDSDSVIMYFFLFTYPKILCVHIFYLDNIKLLFSEKLVVWSNDTVGFDLPMESASCLKLSISNFIIAFLVSS